MDSDTPADDDTPPAPGAEDIPMPAQDDAHVPDSLTGDSADRGASSEPSGRRGRAAFAQPDAADDTDQSDVELAAESTRTSGQSQTLSIAVVAEAPVTYSSFAPAFADVATETSATVAASAQRAPTLSEVFEEPHTFAVAAVAHAVDAALEVLLAPFGPGTPAQSPQVWATLAFVRDEIERIFFPKVNPGPVPPSPTQSPNLLVNPGAELGDPSLSGYSSVTVPGWAVTGTPTVIEYGTLRRFPVPTPYPGPVLPAVLGFPTKYGPIPTPSDSGRQFFGGGPVATSTLTQTVDLSGADVDGVSYTLSGDLGGFLIDPSSTLVSVNFLDANGVELGTGRLRPVTAWDRLFATGLLHRETWGRIPVGTESAQVVMTFTDRNPVLGNYNNAYADNLSFTVGATGLTPASLTQPASTVRDLDHVFMVYLENKGVTQIVGSPNAPYLNLLINNYGNAANYYALTHPSDPNYYPINGGSDFGINYNCPSNCFDQPSLVDAIEAAGKTWAGYAVGGGGYSKPQDRLPFLAFRDFYNDPQRVATHLFDIAELEQGLANPATAPNFVWFAADDATNMEGPTDFPFGILNWVAGFLSPAHQYNVKAGDEWIQGPLTTIFNSPTWQTTKSAIVVTFDEDYNNLSTGVGNDGNHIVTVVIPSPGAIDAGMRSGAFVVDQRYDHYSLLRTIEEALLADLPPEDRYLTNNDRYAQPMNEFWSRSGQTAA